jgi:septal ring factor EnvC (AmiA/AmiB activator)
MFGFYIFTLVLSITSATDAKSPQSQELQKIEQKLKDLAEAEKKHREWAVELQETLESLKQQQNDTRAALRSQSQQLSRTLGAFRCLSANSPATFIATLHSQDDFVHTSLLLRRLMPYLQQVGQSLTQELMELANVRSQIIATEASLQKASKKLSQQQRELNATLAKLRTQEALDVLTSEDLNAPLKETATLMTTTQNRIQDIAVNFSRPVSGPIVKAFGHHESYHGRGVLFQGQPREIVSAPASGRITTILPTPQGYRMVIQHTKGYQTILEGFEQVSRKTGDVINIKDALGALPSPLFGPPVLFCEIQRFQQSINPSFVFKSKP